MLYNSILHLVSSRQSIVFPDRIICVPSEDGRNFKWIPKRAVTYLSSWRKHKLINAHRDLPCLCVFYKWSSFYSLHCRNSSTITLGYRKHYCVHEPLHYDGVIMSTVAASQITSVSIVYSAVCLGPECVTGLCEENSPVTGEFPAQRASNAEKVSTWWRHHYLRVSLFVM